MSKIVRVDFPFKEKGWEDGEGGWPGWRGICGEGSPTEDVGELRELDAREEQVCGKLQACLWRQNADGHV